MKGSGARLRNPKPWGILGLLVPLVSVTVLIAPAQGQHDAHMMGRAAAAKLDAKDDPAAHVLTVRLGPLHLPAHAGMAVEQAPGLTLTVPFEGWITAYHPRLTDGAGRALPDRLLHHVAFYNTGRPDFLCPAKPEHIFGAGGEMNDWPATPGFGYRVHQGERILISTMFHNETETSHPDTYLEVRIEYQPLVPGGAGLKNVYPTWFDVKNCGRSGYDLTPGENVTTGRFSLGYSGALIGVGGHLHDYGRQLRLVDTARKQDIAKLDAKLDPRGRIVSVPVVRFTDRGGYHLNKGDVVQVTAIYDNPTGKLLPEGAMGIVVGYFLPDDDRQMAALRKKGSGPSAHN